MRKDFIWIKPTPNIQRASSLNARKKVKGKKRTTPFVGGAPCLMGKLAWPVNHNGKWQEINFSQLKFKSLNSPPLPSEETEHFPAIECGEQRMLNDTWNHFKRNGKTKGKKIKKGHCWRLFNSFMIKTYWWFDFEGLQWPDRDTHRSL